MKLTHCVYMLKMKMENLSFFQQKMHNGEIQTNKMCFLVGKDGAVCEYIVVNFNN